MNLTHIDCSLGPQGSPFDVGLAQVAPGGLGAVMVTSAQSFSSAMAVNLYCEVNGTGHLNDVKLLAIKVGTLTASTG